MQAKSRIVFALLAMSLLVACPSTTPQPVQPAKPSPTANPAVPIVPVDLLQDRQFVSGQLLDARSRQLVKAETRIRISGADAARLEQTSLTTQNGHIGLVLKKGVKPSSAEPLHLTLVAEAPGYFIASSQLHLSDAREAFSLRLTSKTQPPPGVGVGSDSGGLAGSDGTLSQGVTLNASAGATQASFSLSSGAVVTSADGRPLSGPLQAQVGYFSAGTPESLNAFPGGFAPETVLSGGQARQGYFQTGGFVSVDISDAGGNKAARFSQPAQVKIELPAGTPNPETGQPLKAGDSIGIWSHDTETGKWSLESQGQVNAGTGGNFQVDYTVGHLSYWNLDWFLSARCNPELKLSWNSANQVPVTMQLLMDDQNWYTHSNLLQDPINFLYNVPVGRELTFVASFGTQEVGRSKVNLDASCQPITVNIDSQRLPKLRSLPLKVTLGSQTRFSAADIQQLCVRFGINQTLANKILAYTHPNGLEQLFSFSDKAYQDLQGLGVSADQIQGLKFLLGQTYSPTTYLGYYPDNDPSSYSSVYANEGQGQVSVFENTDYRFNGYFYYNNKTFYLDQLVRIRPGDTEVRLALTDVELTLEIVRGFLAQLGIQLPV